MNPDRDSLIRLRCARDNGENLGASRLRLDQKLASREKNYLTINALRA